MTYSNHGEFYLASRYAKPYSIRDADVLGEIIHRQLQKELNMNEPKPTQEWGFAAKPDFARICREVAATGADVARVSSRGSNPVTLVRSDSPAGATWIRKHLFGSYVMGASDWMVLAGDHVAALTEPKPEPVKVEAFGGRKLGAVAIDLETAQTKPGAVAPPPVAPVTVKVRTHAGAGSVVEYVWGDQLRKPELGWNAFLATDGKVYGSSDFGRRRAVGIIVSGETWGVFDWLGRRSSRFPNTFDSKAGAETFLQTFVPHSQRLRYHARLITDPVAQRPMGTIRTIDPSAPAERWGIFGGEPSGPNHYRSSDYPLTYPTKAAAEAEIQRIPEPPCTTCRYRAERLP